MQIAPNLRLVYVGDPMCSWCWGFAPVLEALTARHGLPVDVIVGGLRPGPEAAALDDSMRDYLRGAWTQVREATGQPFDFESLERDDWVYDTEIPAMAVVAMRRLQPELALPFFVRVQRAFYAEAVDVTLPESFPPLVAEIGADPGAFMTALTEGPAKDETWNDFALARQMGVAGFPTLFATDQQRLLQLTYGYRPLAEIEHLLTAASRRFEEVPPDPAKPEPS